MKMIGLCSLKSLVIHQFGLIFRERYSSFPKVLNNIK